MAKRLRFTQFGLALTCILLLFTPACSDKESQAREFAIRRSVRNYWNALDLRTEESLRTYVYFPGVLAYRKHVSDLFLEYLESAAKGSISFDEQGVVISRFLRLQHLNYQIKELKVSEDGLNAVMRIGINFAYDALLDQADYEEGTKVYVPVEPLGTVAILVAGEENNTPRSQLSYLELTIELRKTNFEDYWQVRKMIPVDGSDRYDVSLKDRF